MSSVLKYLLQMPDNCTNPTLQSTLNRSSKDKFILVLNLPHVLKKLSAKDPTFADLESIQMSVFGAIVPDVTVPAIQVPYGGQVINVSSHTRPNYAPLTINIVIDNTYTNYYVLWKWLSVLNNPRSSTYDGTPDSHYQQSRQETMNSGNLTEYEANFSILALNEYNETVTEFKYYNAFITSLKGINYSYKDGEMMETTAEFQFSQFDMEKKQIFSFN
ncbi:MAG: hypothetical protein RL709_80 [Pseudomonadota bacterium]